MRECEKKTKDNTKAKEQYSQMQLMSNISERSWMDSWPEIIKTKDRVQMSMEDAYQLMAGSYKEDNME